MQLYCTTKFTLLFLGSSLAFTTNLGYNVLVLQNTTTTRPILLDLPSDIIDRSAFMYSILDSGWIRVAYRKDDGSTAIRLGTRNPTLVAKYGSSYDVKGIKNSEFDSHSVHTVLYYDHMAGGLRCFRVKNVDGAGIDAESFENNH